MRVTSRIVLILFGLLSAICAEPISAQLNSPNKPSSVLQKLAPTCASADLDISYQFANQADIQQVTVTLRNISSRTCTLRSGEGVAFGGHGHSVWTKECRNCELDGTAKKVPPLEVASGESGQMIVRWKTQPAAGETCQHVGNMNGQAWRIWAVSLFRDVCSVVYEDSYLPVLGNEQKQTFADSTDAIDRPVKIELTASDETFYSGDSVTLHIRIQDRGDILKSENDSCPLLLVRIRGADGSTILEQESGRCQTTPLANQPGNMINLDLETLGWGALFAPMEHSVQAFAVLDSAHAPMVEMAASNVLHFTIHDPNKIPQTWGPESGGVAISLSLDKATYPIGHDIPLRMAVENFSADVNIISGELPCFADFAFELRDSSGHLIRPSGEEVCTGHGWYSRYPKGSVVPVRGFTLRGLGLLPSEPGKYTLLVTWNAQSENPNPHANAPNGSPSSLTPYVVVRSDLATFNIEPPPQ